MIVQKPTLDKIVGLDLNNEHAIGALVDMQFNKDLKTMTPPFLILDDVRLSTIEGFS